MEINQDRLPLYEKLIEHTNKNPISLHVPGHKNGGIKTIKGHTIFGELMKLDQTEITGLDDLHAADGVIKEAQHLAAEWFGAKETFFLVNGSTVGNLAMILATCKEDDYVLVQRNCHKSIINGLELAGAKPIFLAPNYNKAVNRLVEPTIETVQYACKKYSKAKALILTYPDYFGHTYHLKDYITIAHQYDIPVLVDEAHGCHYSIPYFNKPSAISLGADMVVQSAHKMTPALTMSAFLHIGKGSRINEEEVKYYLQMLQSSSPSYLMMASLDIARHYLALYTYEKYKDVTKYIHQVKQLFQEIENWLVEISDDPLKIILKPNHTSTKLIAQLLEEEQLYPELITNQDILLIFGLEETVAISELEKRLDRIKQKLKRIKRAEQPHEQIQGHLLYQTQELVLSYKEMRTKQMTWVDLDASIGCVAAEAIIPYPPGIPIILKGERIHSIHIEQINYLQNNHITFQPYKHIKGLNVFKGE
ncbi:aminotransferase class I/II-fold pyridoxal phosphate-dependent enzyme [Gracilibacillus marinus]|uniref:Aminotransferase class I/II-fold pyridoxal phosphate-dependent enzyme n=1 Tax=Gracilibacillus marinus TaxID=630535 RepID=A0ABV8VXP3_9BACI